MCGVWCVVCGVNLPFWLKFKWRMAHSRNRGTWNREPPPPLSIRGLRQRGDGVEEDTLTISNVEKSEPEIPNRGKTTKGLIRDFTTTPLPIPKIFLVVYLLKLSSECLVSYDPHFPGNDGTNYK